MTTEPNYIVFQCYGSEAIFHECTFALLSLSRLYPGGLPQNTSIWIYTDNQEYFKSKKCNLPLNYIAVDGEKIKKWRGAIDFVHRVKIEVLLDFTASRPGNILYADTDVVFTQPIKELFAHIGKGALYMHVSESIISERVNPITNKLCKYLENVAPEAPFTQPLQHMTMWNAGVLGFNTSHKQLLKSILAFTDLHYPVFPKHIIEQFAFSIYFAITDKVKTASPFILHYWNLKEVRQVLTSFFEHFKNHNWEALSRYSTLIQMPVLMQEKANHPHTLTLVDKMKRKKWQPPSYKWEEMVTQIT